MKFRSQLACLFATTLVAACGGGSDDATDAPSSATTSEATAASTLSFPVNKALDKFQLAAQSFTLTAVDPVGLPYTMLVTQTPSVVPSSDSLQTTRISVVIKQGETPAISSDNVVAFQSSPYPYLEVRKVRDNKYEFSIEPNGALLIPDSAKVGELGLLTSADIYQIDGESRVSVGKQTMAWELLADTATTAWLCIKTATEPKIPDVPNETACYKLDKDGVVSGSGSQKVTLTVGTETLSFK